MKYLLKDNRTGKESEYKTEFSYTIKKNEIEFSFKCEKSQRFSADEGYNTELYNGDVCEIFISTGEKQNEYYELEVAPNNSKFFTFVINDNGKRQSKFIKTPFCSTVEMTETGYNVIINIPFSLINYDEKKGAMFNAYRIETEGGERDKFLMALSPTMTGTFHKPEYFIKL